MKGLATILGAAYAVLVVIHLVAQLNDHGMLADVTQWIAMPLLIATLFASRPARGRLITLTVLALGLSWLGDAMPDFFTGDTAFLVMVGFFLLAQIAYIAAFLPWWRSSYVGSPMLILYVAAIGALVYLCAPHAGDLLIPVLIYGFALGTMAVLAGGLNGFTALGGALFLISDGLIALGAFAPDFDPPQLGFWIMLTYLVGQGFLAYGVYCEPPRREVFSRAPDIVGSAVEG